MQSLIEWVETRLVELIPKQVAAERIKEPVYCLLLGHYCQSGWSPPSIALGSQALRRGIIEDEGENAKGLLWSPEDMDHWVEDLDDPELLRRCETLNAKLPWDSRRGGTEIQALLNRVAAKLMRRKWSKELKVTRDFVVLAIDAEEQCDLQESMKASVPAPIVARLRARGLL